MTELNLERVTFSEIRETADHYCALCGRVAEEDEKVLANLELLPTPWICEDCFSILSFLIKEGRL